MSNNDSYCKIRVHCQSMSLLFKNISHSYGQSKVLDNISLEAYSGKITCLIGPSGSGKTTLLRLAAGLENIQSGEIYLDGKQIAINGNNLPPEKRSIGLIFQESALFPHMTVKQNIAFGLTGIRRKEQETRINHLLLQVGMEEYGERYPHTLSGGQQQRIALIRTLAPRPRVILMDEPYANIDIARRRSLREMAQYNLKNSNSITILVTHDPAEAMEMADNIYLLDHGKIIQSGKPEELYCQPANIIVANLFADTQSFKGTYQGNCFSTPFGPIYICPEWESNGLEQGKSYTIATRPEGLKYEPVLESGPQNRELEIRDVRFIGDKKIMFASSDETAENQPALRIQMRNEHNFESGIKIRVFAAKTGFFCFP